MIKIKSDDLELVYFDIESKNILEIIKDITVKEKSIYFGEITILIENLDNGYLIYRNKILAGFIAITKSNEISLLIKKEYCSLGIASKALNILFKIDKRTFNYYIDSNNYNAIQLKNKIIHRSRL